MNTTVNQYNADRDANSIDLNVTDQRPLLSNSVPYLLAIHFNERSLLLRLRQAGVDQTERNGIAANV